MPISSSDKPATYEIRESTIGPGWQAIYQNTPGAADTPPESQLVAVLTDANLRALTQALGRHHAALMDAASKAAQTGELCGASPSKGSTARCENHKPCLGKPHSGRTAGSRWKHWFEPISKSTS